MKEHEFIAYLSEFSNEDLKDLYWLGNCFPEMESKLLEKEVERRTMKTSIIVDALKFVEIDYWSSFPILKMEI